MSIFDFAIQMEEDGEKFYRELAEKSKNEGLKTIFNKLADDELEHYQVFQNIKDHTPLDVKNTTVLEDSKNIFAGMKPEESFDFGDVDEQKKAYHTALEMEMKSFLFYEEKAEEADTPEAIKLLRAIAKEERRHYRLVEGLLEFISRPDQWIEDAEYVNLTEY